MYVKLPVVKRYTYLQLHLKITNKGKFIWNINKDMSWSHVVSAHGYIYKYLAWSFYPPSYMREQKLQKYWSPPLKLIR